LDGSLRSEHGEILGIPGLSFMARYGKGTDADYSNANNVYMRRDAGGNPLTDQKRERDIEVKYVVQNRFDEGYVLPCACQANTDPLSSRV
jgi:hypothetical protein